MPHRGAIYILAEFCKRERVFCLLFLGGIKTLPSTSKSIVGQSRGVIIYSGVSRGWNFYNNEIFGLTGSE